MSLETRIEALTAAVVALTAQMAGTQQMAAAAAPVAQTAPAAAPFTPPAAAAPTGMPGAPFGAPAAGPAAAPFTDAKGHMDYSVASYNQMVTTKGQDVANTRFNQILTACGVDNINNVPAAQYANYYNLMEQAKAAA